MIQKPTRDWHRLRKIIVHTSTNRWKSCICIDALQNLLGKMWKWLASDNLGRFVRHCPELPISDQVRLDSNVGDYLNEIKDVKRVDFHMIWHDFTEKQKDTSITSICDRDHDGVAEQRARSVCFGTALVRSYSFCLQEHFQMQCLLSLVSELTLCWSSDHTSVVFSVWSHAVKKMQQNKDSWCVEFFCCCRVQLNTVLVDAFRIILCVPSL